MGHGASSRAYYPVGAMTPTVRPCPIRRRIKMSGSLTMLTAMRQAGLLSEAQPGTFWHTGHDIEVVDARAARALAQIIEHRDKTHLRTIGRRKQVE